jgi:hypothetical protein
MPHARLVGGHRADLTGQRQGLDQGHAPDAVAAPGQVDPLSCAGDFVVHEQHGVGRFVEMMQRTVAGASASTSSRVRPEQARPARRPALRADRPARPGHPLRRRRGAHAATGSAARTGPRPRQGPQGTSSRSPPSSSSSTPRGWPPRATPSPRTRPWQRELEDAFPTSRPPTSCRHRRGQGRHGEARSRWTASSAATSATARPRSPCARRSRRCRTASRWPCWCRPPAGPAALPDLRRALCAVPGHRAALSRFQSDKEAKRPSSRARRRQRRRRHRHPPAALLRR